METTPVVDQSKLVAYNRPEKEPMSEEKMRALSSLSGTLYGIGTAVVIISFAFGFFQFIVMMTSYSYNFVPLVAWPVVITLVVLGIAMMIIASSFQGHFIEEILWVYSYVPQGMIVKMDTRGGGNYSLRWVVLVEGFNSLNQRRIQEHTIDAGTWYELEVGDYVDYRDEEDKENSMSTPLQEARVGAEM